MSFEQGLMGISTGTAANSVGSMYNSIGEGGEKKAVTVPRDFRWLKPEWKSHKDDMS